MRWINFHIKHTDASQCSIIHLAVWTMRKGLSRNYSPIHAEMQSCVTEWKMSIMGWVWLLVPLRVCGYHRNGEEKGKVRVVEELGHFQ